MVDASAKKQQMEYIIIAVLLVVALFVAMGRLRGKGQDDKLFSREGFKSTKEWREVEILKRKLPKKEEGVSYAAFDKKIPFKGPLEDKEKKVVIEEKVVLPPVRIQGMIWNSMRPQAIINSRVHEVNDMIAMGEDGQAEIEGITKKGVHLRYKGKEFIVKPKSAIR